METFNLIITGVGGQGIITLVSVVDEACILQGYDIKSSELHGLSQRGGSVVTHVRLGDKINSPLVTRSRADLVMGLEMLETLRQAGFSDNKTVFLVNKNLIGFDGCPPEEQVIVDLKKIAKEGLHLIEASQDCQKELGIEVVSTIYLLGYAVKNNLIPLKKEIIIHALKNIIPEKYLELNLKAFNLGYIATLKNLDNSFRYGN